MSDDARGLARLYTLRSRMDRGEPISLADLGWTLRALCAVEDAMVQAKSVAERFGCRDHVAVAQRALAAIDETA